MAKKQKYYQRKDGLFETIKTINGKRVAFRGHSCREVDQKLLAEAIGAYLDGLSREARTVFLERYWFLDPVTEIAARRGISEAKTKSMLYRTRQGLRAYLGKEGFEL